MKSGMATCTNCNGHKLMGNASQTHGEDGHPHTHQNNIRNSSNRNSSHRRSSRELAQEASA